MIPKIKLLKRELPHGAIRELARRMPQYSYYKIASVIRGDVYKQDVIDCAISYLEELKSNKSEIEIKVNRKIKSIVS